MSIKVSDEYKVYVEAYGALYEVINPTYTEDGVEADLYRAVKGDRWHHGHGLFRNAVVYENLDTLFDRTLSANAEVTIDLTDEACVSFLDFLDADEVCCGDNESCSDCPQGQVDSLPGTEIVGEAIDALLTIAEDDEVDAYNRIEAARTVIDAVAAFTQA